MFFVALKLALALASASDLTWTKEERGVISPEGLRRDYRWVDSVRAPLNPYAPSEGSFDLYYFSPSRFRPDRPTVLYLTGGPGGTEHRENLPLGRRAARGANIIYFHLRGTGASQIPPENTYDTYLRTEYAVFDLEQIRKALNVAQWDTVIGESYGAFLGHRYAFRHPQSLRRFVAGSPIYSSESWDYAQAHDGIARIVPQIMQAGYAQSQLLHELGPLWPGLLGRVESTLDEMVREGFTPEQIVRERLYDDEGFRRKFPNLARSGLFWRAIEVTKWCGWAPLSEEESHQQIYLTGAIVEDFHRILSEEDRATVEETINWLHPREVALTIPDPDRGGVLSNRVNSVMGTYDGYLSHGDLSVVETPWEDFALHAKVGKRAGWNFLANRYSASREPLTVPTLVVAGTADRITPTAEAEAYYENALKGPKKLVLIEGAGHKSLGAPRLDGFWRNAVLGHWNRITPRRPWRWNLGSPFPRCVAAVIRSESPSPLREP